MTQPDPVPNGADPVIDDAVLWVQSRFRGRKAAALTAALRARAAVGVARYGTPLQPHNGRDAKSDAREELLDAVLYLTQAVVEGGDVAGCGEARWLAAAALCEMGW